MTAIFSREWLVRGGCVAGAGTFRRGKELQLLVNKYVKDAPLQNSLLVLTKYEINLDLITSRMMTNKR